MNLSIRLFSRTKIISVCLLLSVSIGSYAQDHLQQCWDLQVKEAKHDFIKCSYTESLNELHHSFEPWQQTAYIGQGTIWYNASSFLKQDSLKSARREYASLVEYRKEELLFRDYGDDGLYPVDLEMLEDFPLSVARYNPVLVIDAFLNSQEPLEFSQTDELAVYVGSIGKSTVTLNIRQSDSRLQELVVMSDDELFGDVLTTYHYSGYKEFSGVSVPTTIRIEKINGKLQEEVNILSVSREKSSPTLLNRPEGYGLTEPEIVESEWSAKERFEGIHFLELYHTDDRVMLVEFDDFFLVAEAPVSSANGELIISEARKIASNKPIKYFVYGHYHQHYIGGIRPFVADGAEIICSEKNEAYMRYIVDAPRTLNPDRLQEEPRELKIKEIKDSLTISDENLEMIIYFIGEQSAHTNDYLIYYFPKYNLLFQDDLVWIKEEGKPKKAGKRQAGLYNAIADLDLDVELIIQSWPVSGHGVKTEIPFEDLEKSMEVD